MSLAALSPSNVAVVTGGASGIGLAAAMRFAEKGLKVCIADRDTGRLDAAAAAISARHHLGGAAVLAVRCDVRHMEDLVALERSVRARFGRIDILMNNAGIQPGSSLFSSQAGWDEVIAVNLWGVINGSRAFAPGMIDQRTPALIINTGSKQGITTPPGDPAYNVSKAGVKVFTEALEHELRTTPDCQVSARLLIPGFVFTPLTAKGGSEKPPGAWTPEQTVQFMLERLEAGDFYLLCPDNEVSRETDEKRIRWAAEDMIQNRPPLSRWHPRYGSAFNEFLGTK